MTEIARLCFHCGEPVPSNCELCVEADGQSQPVCCNGCEAVANLILQSGQSRYYQFRTESSLKPTDEDAGLMDAWKRYDERQSLWGSHLKDGAFELLLQVEGIRCAACAWLIRSQLEARVGIDQVQVDVTTGFVRINWHPDKLRLSKIAASISGIGYRPHLPLAGAETLGRQEERRDALKRLGVAGLGMMQVMMFAAGLYAGDAMGISEGPERFLQWVSLIVTAPVLLYSGRVFYTSAWRSLSNRRVGMDVPVALAISIAFIMSCINFLTGDGHVYFDSVVMFIFFLSLGRYAELVIRHRNLQTGLALARLLPEWAELIRDGKTERILASDLCVTDRVRVRAGQTFPADGLVTAGSTDVNEALLTGESRPVVKRPGDPVIAGSINQTQAVEVEVSKDPDDSTVSVMGRMLLKSQTHRSRYARLSERFAGWFVAAVLSIAGLTAMWWLKNDVSILFPATLAVLVISCPCALSLATPAAIASSSRALLEQGVLLTRGVALEALCSVDSIVFDKTGTLTTGSPTVVDTVINPERKGFSQDDVLRIAALLELDSSHPVSKAFSNVRVSRDAIDKVRNHENGVEGRVDNVRYHLGNSSFTGVDNADMSGIFSRIWLTDESGWLAYFDLDDGLRDATHKAISTLKQKGYELSILSGDRPQAVESVAQRTGIDTWHAEQSPKMKMEFLKALQSGGKTVLMVGDGINDAPVLSVANVSMTVSGASELANSAADFIITGNSLIYLVNILESGHKTQVVIRQNLLWALSYNLLAVPFAAAGLIVPWMAALGMSLSSLLVVLNSGRLARRKVNNPALVQHEVSAA
ncbi:MAG: cadmium-translocating P-type ATPase [Gammaproteobacteria bacterium]|nr:cadmium-translocating P-type ATPase [Gammaproteobacteria bacterium]